MVLFLWGEGAKFFRKRREEFQTFSQSKDRIKIHRKKKKSIWVINGSWFGLDSSWQTT